MAAIITREEVAGVLNRSPVPDAPWAEQAIAVAESWLRNQLGAPRLGEAGPVVTTASDVRSDAFVYCPVPATKVEVKAAPGSALEPLPAGTWTEEADGVRLRAAGSGAAAYWPYGYDDPAGPEPLPVWYVEVRVTSESDGVVDPVVKFACALAAAAVLTRAPRLAKGLTGERIGDYGYTVAPLLAGDPFFEQSKSVLRQAGLSGSQGVAAT